MNESKSRLIHLADALVRRAETADTRIEEGLVRTAGRPPYRRLDVAGHALCYIRVRPKRRVVRIDVARLWSLPDVVPCKLGCDNGRAMVLSAEADVDDAVRFLIRILDDQPTG